MNPRVVSVSLSNTHHFSKSTVAHITLLAGLGVQGDSHSGVTVQHRSRVAQDPTQPNLRQVHFIHAELFDELTTKGFTVGAGQLGENITTAGIDLLALPVDAELHIGTSAIVKITGLRNPCAQLDNFQPGLTVAVLDRGADGALIRKAGIMGVVLAGGSVSVGDAIRVVLPLGPQRALERV